MLGPFIPKPKTAALFKSMSPAEVTYEEAIQLLSLPREIGLDPESGNVITAQNGKYGPYLKKGTDSRSLASEEQIFSLTLDVAVEIYKQPKYGGRRTAATPLKEFGEDPASKLNGFAKTGQFGDYVTDGVVNATIPKDEPLGHPRSGRAGHGVGLFRASHAAGKISGRFLLAQSRCGYLARCEGRSGPRFGAALHDVSAAR